MVRRSPRPAGRSSTRRRRAIAVAPPKVGPTSQWRRWAASARRPSRRLWTAVVGLGTVIGLITGVLALLDDPRIRPSRLSPMQGDLRLAVAPFDSIDARQGHATSATTTAATRVATSVADVLTKELAPLRGSLRVELRPPAQIRPIGETSPARQAEVAAARARQHGADMLVYGTLIVESVNTRLEPHVFLAGSVRPDADELLGDHKLGAAVDTPGDPETNQLFARDLAERLAARVRALAALSVGVSYYHLDRLAEADHYLTLAAQTSGWRDGEGTELLHLLVGNVAARRGAALRLEGKEAAARAQFKRALRAYQAALAVQPGYARATYGIAETRFLQLNLTCESTTRDDIQRLRQVAAGFTAAGRAPYQPAGANLDLKIDFGLGRVYVCLSLAGDDHRAQATAHLGRVLAAVDPPTRPQTVALTRLAADAHGQLGLLAFAEPDGPTRRAQLQAAVGHYQRAIALSQARHDQAQVFWANLAAVFDQLGEPAAAAKARAQAQSLATTRG
jgi:tetratricopeptide (TPR) repeat protein